MQTCQNCGQSNPDEARFCQTCACPTASNPAVATPVASGGAETSGKAIASLICGILFLVLPAAVAAIILGHLSLSDIHHSAGRLTGRGMAVAGLVLGYLGATVIPFILILVAIAIPNLLRAKMATNEAAAVGRLRTLTIATVTYSATYGNGFPPSLGSLGGAAEGEDASCDHALLIDSLLLNSGAGNTSEKTGYVFHYRPGTPVAKIAAGCSSAGVGDYSITADPITVGSTGVRHFFVDESGVIRVEEDSTATRDSPAIQ